jgi:hypothetical protein
LYRFVYTVNKLSLQIANHLLAVNLTPEQKTKLEEQLAKLTPEQQESFYQVNLSQRLQKRALLKQQQLQGQNVAPVKQEQVVTNQNTTTLAQNLMTVTVQVCKIFYSM